MRAWIIGIFCLVVVSSTWAVVMKESPMVTVIGKLIRVAAIGGETTGWALELESDLKFDSKRLKRIEVDPADKRIEEFEDKRVEVKGRLSWGGGGPERGYYPIIEIKTIRKLKP